MVNAAKAKSAVLTVGDGRGFVVSSRGERVVITGAHCSPQDLSDELDAYETLVESIPPLAIADAPEKGRTWFCHWTENGFNMSSKS